MADLSHADGLRRDGSAGLVHDPHRHRSLAKGLDPLVGLGPPVREGGRGVEPEEKHTGEERESEASGHGWRPLGYQVLSFRSSWICSFGTGSSSMWSFSHWEKSFSMTSVQRWSISPGV